MIGCLDLPYENITQTYIINIFLIMTKLFPHSWLYHWFVTRVTRQVSLYGAGTAYPSLSTCFHRLFSVMFVSLSLSFSMLCFEYHCLSLCLFSFAHCIVCTSTIDSFWLHLWFDFDLIFGILTPLSAIFQLYHGDQFWWWRKPEYPERTTDPGQAYGKLYHLRLRVECTLFVIYKAGREPTPLHLWYLQTFLIYKTPNNINL